MHEKLKKRLSPFRHKSFRKFFVAQTLSMIGQWSHDLARSWIIVEATGSSGALGNLNLAIAVPCLFLILQAGVIVDRTDIRRLIQRTKTLLGLSSLVLAALTEFGHLEVWHLLVFGLIEGLVVSFDSPGFQALIVRLVPREDFQQAIALNSTNFHTSRMLGPILAAWLMSWWGPSLVFLFDALTYFLVAIVLINVDVKELPRKVVQQSSWKGIREGFRYIYASSNLRYRVAQLLLTISCVYPLMVSVFRVFVQKKFNLDASEFGTAFTFAALGSMSGALTFAIFQPQKPIRALWFGVPLVFVMLLVFPYLPSLWLTVSAMTLTGFGLYLTFASLTVSMHLEVDESFRGRMSSVIGLNFAALGPLMSFPWGHLADWMGPPRAILLAALIFGTGSAALGFANALQER
ncbi:MAG: MFS transporter [Bdellovibrionales bacterium]